MAGHEGQGGHNRSREKKDNGEDEIPLLAREHRGRACGREVNN